MIVIPATKKICDEWVKIKHYSHRASIYWKGFVLLENSRIEGVLVFGQPSPAIQMYAFKDRDFRMYELSRVVVQTKTQNATSFFVSNALKQLTPKPCAVVSYADSEFNHCGIIYQATNWLYTGSTVTHDCDYLIGGKRVPSISLRKDGITSPKTWAKENGVEIVRPKPKHRYFFFVGDKREKKVIKSKLKYKQVHPYPKCDQNRYDDGPRMETEIDPLGVI